jgi:GT2 family glycosyltransferase
MEEGGMAFCRKLKITRLSVKPVHIDMIILSFARDEHLRELTLQAIDTLRASEDPQNVVFHTVVIESNRSMAPYQYPFTETIYPTAPFGYHRYMNIGIRHTHSPYVCMCNNDLVFHGGWASAMIEAMEQDPALLSASPYCPVFHTREGFQQDGPPVEAYFGVLTGWCIFVLRPIFDIIGLLDERLLFWYCDADYCQTLLEHGLRNCLIPSSRVTHLGSESFRTMPREARETLMKEPELYYRYKWSHRSRIRYWRSLFLFHLRKWAAG